MSVDKEKHIGKHPMVALANGIVILAGQFFMTRRAESIGQSANSVSVAPEIGLRVRSSPSSDNLSPQETTNQHAPQAGTDGVTCPDLVAAW
jgi:hypothetical protein